MVKIGIIGGSGVYDHKLLEDAKEVKASTPFGRTSDVLTVGKFKGVDVVFLPRHGRGHVINPTHVNYRANIWAMKELGVTHIFAPSAVGSLKEEYRPGELVFTDQFIDRTTKRTSTFYEGSKVCHISVAEPCCGKLRNLLAEHAHRLQIPHHKAGTCVVVEGPRFSTKAESRMFRSWGADIIGMTMVPEVVLAREAEICYATIAMVTDYDVWREGHVSFEEVIRTMNSNVDKMRTLLTSVVPAVKGEDCSCRHALETALI